MLTIMLWEQDLGYGITNKNQILNILMKNQTILEYGYKDCNSQC